MSVIERRTSAMPVKDKPMVQKTTSREIELPRYPSDLITHRSKRRRKLQMIARNIDRMGKEKI
jgi:hypothetical protein